MKKQSLSICCVTLLALLALSPAWSQGQSTPGAQAAKLPDKILQFLKGSEMQKRRATFTGEIDPISENLKHLLGQLYFHRFTIVHMRINRDISFTTTKLIVVSDANTGDVVSYLWQGGYDVPYSFKQLLTHYPKDVGLRNSDVLSTAFARLNALANLVVYPDRASNTGYRMGIGGRVGALSAKQKGSRMELSAELIRSLGPSRLLTLQMEESDEGDRDGYNYEGHKYGRLATIDSETGREM
ncbi:MAG: hypothetical protein WAM70_10685 [Pyrinomonadaceae bacterium]